MYFTPEGIVKGYSNVSHNLHIRVQRSDNSALPSDHFSIGSTKDQVLAVQGTPSGVIDGGSTGDIWSYGFSTVEFSPEGAVKGYSNVGSNLRIK